MFSGSGRAYFAVLLGELQRLHHAERFIDAAAEFVWLPAQTQPMRTPRGMLGFDFDGAAFSHVGDRVTIAMIAGASHALLPEQPRAVVAALDAASEPVPPPMPNCDSGPAAPRP